jgi:hypothetical protein
VPQFTQWCSNKLVLLSGVKSDCFGAVLAGIWTNLPIPIIAKGMRRSVVTFPRHIQQSIRLVDTTRPDQHVSML